MRFASARGPTYQEPVAHELDLILTLTGALTAALVLGLLARAVRLSPIVGYLLAGVAVGPFTPGFVAHTGVANQLAELGVILLMFGVGLNLHVDELVSVRRVALPGALAAMTAASCAGFLVARAFGWSMQSSAVYGLALAASSTVVLIRVFADRGLSDTEAGHIAIGWLLVEDLFVVLVVVLLPLFIAPEAERRGEQLFASVATALAKIGGLVAFTLVVGKRVLPRVLALIEQTKSRELFTLAVLVIALGVAVGSAELFGASMALGAFLAGLVVGQSDFAARAASEALPMRDAFAVLFFVATGMQVDPSQLRPNLPLTLATLAVIWLAKPTVALLVMRAFGRSRRTALSVALGLGQIGEFSFMLAALGSQLRALPPAAAQSLVAASMLAIAVNPLLLGLVPNRD